MKFEDEKRTIGDNFMGQWNTNDEMIATHNRCSFQNVVRYQNKDAYAASLLPPSDTIREQAAFLSTCLLK